jgi:DMSO/TMAO reductase YedYZ molybdopterin-dependent catalytic subunit
MYSRNEGKERKGTMKRVLCAVALVLLALLFSTLAPALPGRRLQERKTNLRIEGAVEKSGDWTVESLSKEFAADVKTVPYTLKGVKGEARCVPLLSLVEAAKPRLNAKIKNHQLAFVILVRGDDGYTVAFSLGELLPTYGKRAVWLALDHDGKPLSDKEAPAELIVPEDEKPSRWVHAVTRITLVDGASAEAEKPK